MDALAGAITTRLSGEIENLQVDGRMIPSPTVPSIDVYPADPFQQPLAMGKGNNQFFFTVRARVGTADNEGGQDLLLAMMDPDAGTSVAQAIMYDRTLGGVVGKVNVAEGPSAYGLFADAGGEGAYVGCTWTVQVIR